MQHIANNTCRGRDRLQTAIKYFLAVILVLTFVVFSLLSQKFLSISNIRDILRSASILAIAAMGMLLCLTVGDMNFAIGAQISFTGIVIGLIMDQYSGNGAYVLAITLGILASVLVSIVCAVFIVTLKVPSFVGTLGVQMLITGLVRKLNGNTAYFSFNWESNYTFIGQTNLLGIIPVPLVIGTVVVLIVWVLMAKTTRGRNFFALGANPIASQQMGINIQKEKYIAYAICGALVGIAGVLQTSVTKSATITMGSEMLLPTIAACMLGATFLTPGKYNVWGTVIASIFTFVVQYGVICMGLQFNMKDVIQGIILIIAISLVALVRKEGLPQVRFD